MAPPSAASRERPAARSFDRLVALVLAAGVFAIYAATAQGRLWGDGPGMLELLEWEGRPAWRTWAHPGHTPIALFLAWVAPLERAHDAYVLASSVPAALGAGACYLIARLFGAGRAASVSGALLVALSPVLWFFSTVLEVHATHTGTVALCLLASLVSAERRGFVAVHAVLFFVVCLSHLTAVTLVPLWALFGVLASRRVGRTTPWMSRELVVHGVLAGAAYLLAYGVAHLTYHRFAAEDPRGTSVVGLVLETVESFSFAYLRDDWIEPLSWALVPCALLALLWVVPRTRRALDPRLRDFLFASAIGAAFPFVFFVLWSLPNDGGYTAALLPILAVAVALFPSAVPAPAARLGATCVLALLLVPQVVAGRAEVAHHAREFERFKGPQRVEAFRGVLPEGGLVIGMDTLGRPLGWDIDGAEQIDLILVLRGLPDDELQAKIGEVLDTRVVDHPGPIFVDMNYRAWLTPGGPMNDLITAFETEVLARFEHRVVTGQGWPMARLLPIGASEPASSGE